MCNTLDVNLECDVKQVLFIFALRLQFICLDVSRRGKRKLNSLTYVILILILILILHLSPQIISRSCLMLLSSWAFFNIGTNRRTRSMLEKISHASTTCMKTLTLT
jgi:hypothetical protein